MKTTKAHFKYFVTRCEHWRYFFKIFDIELNYYHEDAGHGGHATCVYNQTARLAEIYLNPEWGCASVTQDDLNLSAFHEILEVLTGDLAYTAESRYITPNQVAAANHRIICTLENVVFPLLPQH